MRRSARIRERDASLLCVVEEPGNVAAIEKTREFRGRYHVLWGALSPLKGIGPDEIDIAGLLRRDHTRGPGGHPRDESERRGGGDGALPRPAAEGHAASRVTRIAFGLPVGGDIEYADEVTMARSLENRRELLTEARPVRCCRINAQ